MNDVSMVALRVMSIVGLLVTAITVTLLTVLFASAGTALGRVIRQASGRRRPVVDGTTASASSPRSDVVAKRAA